MCSHEWREMYEEFILGGMTFPIGWECTLCGEFVGKVPPEGLSGKVLKGCRLVGPHGGSGKTSDGRTYKEQVVHEDGSLEVVYDDMQEKDRA